jgi:hypothetical protein
MAPVYDPKKRVNKRTKRKNAIVIYLGEFPKLPNLKKLEKLEEGTNFIIYKIKGYKKISIK